MKKIHSPVVVAVSNKRRRIQNRENQDNSNNNNHIQREVSIGCWMDYESIEFTQCLPSFIGNKNNNNNNNRNESRSTIIHTSIASSTTTEIFINRLHKEIILPFRYSIVSQKIHLHDNNLESIHDAIYRRQIIQKRIICGYNNLSKLLFNATTIYDNNPKQLKPSLIVLVNSSETYSRNNASMVQHIPTLAYEMNVPLLLLPSSYDDHYGGTCIDTSQKLASIFGSGVGGPIKHISMIVFTYHEQQQQKQVTTTSTTAAAATAAATSTTVDGNEYDANSDKPILDLEDDTKQHINNTIDSFVDFIHGKIDQSNL
jgi:hypothetical protein